MGVLIKGEFHSQECIQIGSGVTECQIYWGFIRCAKLEEKNIWKNLWQLHIPNKVGSFAWRASKNILSMKDNLYRRKIIEDSLCVVCGCEPECSGHILWDCEKAREV